MTTTITHFLTNKLALVAGLMLLSFGVQAQNNVFDRVIATSSDHTYFKTALDQTGLSTTLQNESFDYTVFAPSNTAFEQLALDLNTDIGGLLALPNLEDILAYHIVKKSVNSSAISSGDIVNSISSGNTLKFTSVKSGDIYVNQAKVSEADIKASNGLVHYIESVILPQSTVVDVAINNGFTSLYTAVATAGLLPALTDPLADYTVFAPDNAAFNDLATSLNTDISGLLALNNLSDILTYHVLGSSVTASAISNGDVVSPLSSSNTLKMTKTSNGEVYVNQAMVTTANVNAANGIVHAIDAVLLPATTVVDAAIDGGLDYLTQALVTTELLPVLSEPLKEYTVFAPTNNAFDDLAKSLNTDINGLLGLSNLEDILLYHVVSGKVISSQLSNGPVSTLSGLDLTIDLTSGVRVNSSTVTTADIVTDNGVVHIIDKVLVPLTTGIEDTKALDINIYPNPVIDRINISAIDEGEYEILNMSGSVVLQGNLIQSNTIDVSFLSEGVYFIRLQNDKSIANGKFLKI